MDLYKRLARHLPYKYLPLSSGPEAENNLRLLVLWPGREKSIVRCSLQHTSLSSHPSYEALSYTWGNPKGKYSLVPAKGDATSRNTIVLGQRRAKITYNLHEALLQIRHSDQPRTLWVDALCIDQKNLDERSEQVTMMARIFGQAARVLCWLGEGDEQSDLAFKTMEELCWTTKAFLWKRGSQMLQLPICDLPDSFLDVLLDPERSESSLWVESRTRSVPQHKLEPLKHSLSLISIDFTADIPALATSVFGSESLAQYMVSDTGQLSDFPRLDEVIVALRDTFIYRAYWSRLWIVQECTHAVEMTLICGGCQMDFSTMRVLQIAEARKSSTGAAILWNNGDSESVDQLFSSIGGLLSLSFARDYSVEQSLAGALHYHSFKQCSDPRDNVYSLLNIASSVGIDIDYKKSPAEIFVEATKAIISQEKGLNIVISGTAFPFLDPLTLCLPSWVPHFEVMTNSERLTDGSGRKIFGAGGSMSSGRPTHLRTSFDQRVLPIHGCFYGSIKSAGNKLHSFEVEEKSFRNVVEDIQSAAVAWNISLEESWRAIFLDQYDDHFQLVRTRCSRVADQHFRSDLVSFETTEILPKRFLDTLRATINGKAFCITTSNRAAMVLGDVAVGDRIFIARGASVPLVIRPTTGDKTYADVKSELGVPTFYRLVGGSYVDGIMDGEVLEMIDEVNLKEETVYLI